MEKEKRQRIGAELAAVHGGVVHRSELRSAGVSRHHVRTEVAGGRWRAEGVHTVRVLEVPPEPVAELWRAVWESGPGAVLEVATIHAAQWAVSDRQAALLVCLPVQQRLVRPGRLLETWHGVRRSPRRSFLGQVIPDVCDGAHSLGELDFGGWCRRYGLPAPLRQSLRTTASGRVYLDVEWKGLVVEIDGGHHLLGLNPTSDALRANEVALGSTRVLRIPLLGLRLEPARFMEQVARGLGLPVLASA